MTVSYFLFKKKAPSCLEEGAFCGYFVSSITPLAYLPPGDPGGGNNGNNCRLIIHCNFYT